MNAVRLATFFTACVLAVPVSAETLRGVVVGVADGDTMTLLTPDERSVRIRLAEIDAPELRGQPFGRPAKAALSSLVYRRQVTAEVITFDRYCRAVALVEVAGVNVNAAMVRQGPAWANVRYQTDGACSLLEAQACERRVGLWSAQTPHPIPPWQFGKSSLLNVLPQARFLP